MARQYPDCTIARGWTDPAATARGVDTKTAIDILRANTPWHWVPSPVPRNHLTTCLEALRHVMRTLAEGGRPLLQVSPRCKNLRAALAARYRYREVKIAGSVIPSSAPVKDEVATVVDTLGYALCCGGVGDIVQGRVARQSRRRDGEVYIADGVPGGGRWIRVENHLRGGRP